MMSDETKSNTLYKLNYQVNWPDGVIDDKTVIIESGMKAIELLDLLNLTKFVKDKLVGFRVISMTAVEVIGSSNVLLRSYKDKSHLDVLESNLVDTVIKLFKK